MAQTKQDLISRPCADIPEFQRFTAQEFRKQMLMEQTGGGEAFVEAAARAIRKNVLQAMPYASASSRYVHELRRMGVGNEVLDRALARAWMNSADHFDVPRPRRRDWFSSTAALLAYSTLIVLAGLISGVFYLRHIRPDLAAELLGVPPLMAIMGMPVVIVLFLFLRKLFHRG